MIKINKNKALEALKKEMTRIRVKRALNKRMAPNHTNAIKRATIKAGNKLSKAVTTMQTKQELNRRMGKKTGPVKRAVLGKVVYPALDQMKKLRG
jgi:predicted nucleic acid-binding protein